MLRLLLSSCLLGLALAGDYGAPQATCQPKVETLVVTQTTLETQLDQVTVYDKVVSQQTLDVTSVILVPSTLLVSQALSNILPQEVSTRTLIVTSTHYQTQYENSLATVVVTQTSIVGATSVEVTSSVITQTAIIPQTTTLTITAADIRTAVNTVTVNNNVNVVVTKTEVEPFFVTATSLQPVPVLVTATVTDSITNTIEATVTLTRHEFITLCYEPKITYDH